MPISNLPKEIDNLNNLDYLDVSDMNISNLPPVRTNKPCNHVKLMLLCHSDTVKTAMLSRLKPDLQFSLNQTLPDIDIFQWKFKPLFKDKLYFNTWLIGSDYSCRSIYPCFFTTSALYVIVWDLTVSDDLNEQVKVYVDLLVRYVPSANIWVIAVLTDSYACLNNKRKIQEMMASRLRTFFSKLSYRSLCYHGFLMIIANPNIKEGEADLKQRIYDTAQQMIIDEQPAIGNPVPETYFSLIPVLKREKHIFTFQSKPGVLTEGAMWTLFDQALSSNPPDRKDLQAMMEFLKEAGFLLHYTDPSDRLDQIYFTRPEWLYNTLLHVVRHALELHCSLFISHTELCSLANVSWSKDISQALIRLMIHYSIALPIKKDEYLLTFLLPPSAPPSDVLHCGMLRRQFAPKQRSIPIDLWSRLLSSVITNLSSITNVSESKKRNSKEDEYTEDEVDQHAVCMAVWDSGIIYNKKGVKFSIFSCVSEVLTEERGIEICCTRDSYGYVIMARLCWLVQRNLEDQFPHLFSTDTPLQKHQLTQLAFCPICFEKKERNPYILLIEACVHTLHQKNEHQCRYHPELIPLCDLIPDYLLLDFPSDLHLTRDMFEYNEAEPLHKGRQAFLYDGQFKEQRVAVKVFNHEHVSSQSITFPLSLSRVRKEIDMLSSLKHPNILKLFGFCLNPACVLVEKAPLGTLYQKLIKTKEKIPRTVCFHISCQVASAVSYLHQHSIIYHGLDASSILLWSLDFNCDPSVKLANFKQAVYQSSVGLMGKTNFSSSFPATEMCRNSFRQECTEKVDIYSFGILLYELVTGFQPCLSTPNGNPSQKPNLSSDVSPSYSTVVKLVEECLLEESVMRPSADHLLQQLSEPSFQCHIASQILRDCVSVRGCCFVPSVRHIWVYGEYTKTFSGEGEVSEGTQVFILNQENLTVQGSLELEERATAMFTVDNKVWIGMTELCVHVYDTTTFHVTNRFQLEDSATIVSDNDHYVFVGQANGHLKCYSKLDLQKGGTKATNVHIGNKAITAIVTVGDVIWLGCSNEVVIATAQEEKVTIEHRVNVCKSTDQVWGLTVSSTTNTVWCLVRGSHCITSLDTHTVEQRHTTDLSEEVKHVCCEFNCDPSLVWIASLECVNDTLWVGLSCGVIMILTDTERPKEIIHFKAHRETIECLLKIPHSSIFHQQQDCPVILSGGYGEVSSLTTTASEQTGVVMLWHALTPNELSTVSKRHKKYSSKNV